MGTKEKEEPTNSALRGGAEGSSNITRVGKPITADSEGRKEDLLLTLAQSLDETASEVEKKTNFLRAAEVGYTAKVSRLLKEGVKVYSNDKDGMTGLHLAAKEGQIPVVRQLFGEEANIEATDKDNNTALHWAVKKGHTEVVKELLQRNVNVEV